MFGRLGSFVKRLTADEVIRQEIFRRAYAEEALDRTRYDRIAAFSPERPIQGGRNWLK